MTQNRKPGGYVKSRFAQRRRLRAIEAARVAAYERWLSAAGLARDDVHISHWNEADARIAAGNPWPSDAAYAEWQRLSRLYVAARDAHHLPVTRIDPHIAQRRAVVSGGYMRTRRTVRINGVRVPVRECV
jgi:hypothetical protein